MCVFSVDFIHVYFQNNHVCFEAEIIELSYTVWLIDSIDMYIEELSVYVLWWLSYLFHFLFIHVVLVTTSRSQVLRILLSICE
jgi:hypothetical protein